MVAAEGRASVAQLVEEDAQGPDIQHVVVRLVGNHFGGHVFESAAEGVSLRVDFFLYAPAKVTDFQTVFLTNQQILRFQITMDKAVDVEKVDTSNSLNKEKEGFILCELTHLLAVADDVKQIALLHILQDQVDVILVFQGGVQAHDVLVLQLFVDLDFAAQGSVHLRGRD